MNNVITCRRFLIGMLLPFVKMKNIYRIICKNGIRYVVAVLLMALNPLTVSAYITLPTSQYSAKVGDDVTLLVPDAQQGYIDNAVWACPSTNVRISNSDNVSATVSVLSAGVATIELVCTEKYLDDKGFTRSVTYYKEYKITCGTSSGAGDTELKSFTVPKIEIGVGDFLDIEPITKPENAYVYFIRVDHISGEAAQLYQHGGKIGVRGQCPGRTTATVHTYDGKKADVEVVVRFPEIGSVMTDAFGNPAYDSGIMDSVRRMEALIKEVSSKK